MNFKRGRGRGEGNRPSSPRNKNNSRNNRITNRAGNENYRRGDNHLKIRNQNLSGYIFCSRCNKPGHATNQCWNNPNSGSRQPRRWPIRDSCGNCGEMGHTTDTCWHNQIRTSKLSRNDKNGVPTGPTRSKHCSFCNKRGHTGGVCYKRHGKISQQQRSSRKDNADQAQEHWKRPLNCMMASIDGRARYPYNPLLRVERRDERVPGQYPNEDQLSACYWAVDCDGDVLMCTVCSDDDLQQEWCLQHFMARIGRQQNGDIFPLQEVDVVGLERAMRDNHGPRPDSLYDCALEEMS